ncbi:hypothetical protein M5D96_008401 [Drosophila gunungcola]|uniref:Uncharacterized protein n=1 Tax=Drosophila gunungcola TaxID=103775 RepID=A0A9P9YKB0_9MUSC|nr:hypothetical protein M5D96_008401 [Drosophila gunungcola]
MTIIVKALAQLNRGRQQCRCCVGVYIAVAVAVADVAVAQVAAWLSCCWPVSAPVPVPVLVCGAYLGLLQHAIYKCAWDRLCRLVAGSNAVCPEYRRTHYRTVSPSAWPIMLSLSEGASIYEFIVRLSAQEMFCRHDGFFIDGLIIGRNHTIPKAAKWDLCEWWRWW